MLARPLPMHPWGKLNRASPDRLKADRLSLVGHSIDVAAVTRALLALPTWRRRLERLATQALSPTDLDRLTVLAFLHDVGKAGAGFQAKALPDERQLAWRKHHGIDRDQQGHTRVIAPLLGMAPEYEAHRTVLGVDEIRAWGGTNGIDGQNVLDLWLAAVSHHGEPIAFDSEFLGRSASPNQTWTTTLGHYDPMEGLADLAKTARILWPRAYAEDAPAMRPTQALIHAFAGLVSLADWIGSDTRHFPFDLGPQDAERWPISMRAAQEALRAMRIDVEDIRTDLQQRCPSFEATFGFEPTPVQSATGEMPPTSPLVLEAETGSGKTEAALWRFKTLFEAGEVDSLCFLLPTRVAATSIFARVEEFIQNLFPDPSKRPNTVMAVPGYLRANAADGHWLAPFTVLWPDRELGDPLFWAAEHSKRYFAAGAVAGTIDQFLLSTLQTKHAHLRGTVLLRSLVVVDEVHASDPYMRTLLASALQRHHMAGGHSLLLSATLTSDMRKDLLATVPHARKRLGAPVAPPAPEPLHDYPRLTAPGHLRTFGEITTHRRIHHQLQPWMRDPEAVARRAAQAVAAGARVLILRNTVRQAIATQQALEDLLGADHPALFRYRGIVAMHHGRYALPDRRALDARVGDLFGKGAAQGRAALVLCATQTIEISVDCDADYLITDLAPMDVLLQRLGRLHRHAKRHSWRPADYAEAQCVVLTPPDGGLDALLDGGASRGLGLGKYSAYPNLLALQATLDALSDSHRYPFLDIPTHNRALVEQACGLPALTQLAEQRGGAWTDHLQEICGRASAQRSAADYHCIQWQAPWREAAPGELSTEARTRLGLDGIDLELPTDTFSPFGHALERLSLPAWMLYSPPAQGEVGPPTVYDLRKDSEGLHFQVRGQAFCYTRWGLAPA